MTCIDVDHIGLVYILGQEWESRSVDFERGAHEDDAAHVLSPQQIHARLPEPRRILRNCRLPRSQSMYVQVDFTGVHVQYCNIIYIKEAPYPYTIQYSTNVLVLCTLYVQRRTRSLRFRSCLL